MDRILLVEDSETQALRLAHFLEQAGYEVTCAYAAEAAMEQLNQSLPDLVITDFHLPGILGDELCRRIRMNVNTRGIPILILTSEEGGDAEREGLESGADDYVRKTEDYDVLLIRIQVLLRKSHVRGIIMTGTAHFATVRLLVVDDSPTYLQYVALQLGQEGYQVETATTGAEALEQVALRAFDGVVLDLVLPDMSGTDLCRRLAGARRTLDRSFVILGLTGRETKGDMTAVLAAGADDVVGKSRNFDVVRARLRALLRRKLLHEENQRIIREFQEKELALLRARAEKEAAEVRAAVAEQLAQANRELEAANRELKETQAQLVQSAKMASLGQLVAGVAHEINNPLAFVMNHQFTVAQVLEGLAPAIEPQLTQSSLAHWRKARERLSAMSDGMERIKDLVLKLRTFSRLDEGEYKYVKIEESIESVLTLLHHRLKDRITVTRHYGDVKVISCYPGPLNQVIMNVIANAIDAIEGEGEITITTGQSDSMFVISVADTGKGIPESIRERIFEPFYTTKPVGEGTGLGLSISYGIIQEHKGRIEVRSEEGKGTEMIIKIPMSPQGESSNA